MEGAGLLWETEEDEAREPDLNIEAREPDLNIERACR